MKINSKSSPLAEREQPYLRPWRQLCQHWALYCLQEGGGVHKVVDEARLLEPLLFRWLGIDLDVEQISPANVRATLHQRRMDFSKTRLPWPRKSILFLNARSLARKIGLNRVELRLLIFLVLAKKHFFLGRALESFEGSQASVHAMLAVLLEAPVHDIRSALSDEGRLWLSGVLNLTFEGSNFFGYANILDELPEALLSGKESGLLGVKKNILVQVVKAENYGEGMHFAHLEPRVVHLKSYLEAAVRNQMVGVNILLHGDMAAAADLAFVISQELGAALYRVPFASSRAKIFHYAQAILPSSCACGALLLLDRIEDFGLVPGELEIVCGIPCELPKENAVPAIWVGPPEKIDPAILPRFSYCLEVPTPTLSARASVIATATAGIIDREDTHGWAATHSDLDASFIAQAAEVARVIVKARCSSTPAEIFEEVVDGTRTVTRRGQQTLKSPVSAIDYRLDTVNASMDLNSIVEGLRRHPHGRLCFYGPSGTGKSAYAKHLADQLHRPTLLQLASDIISPWVGKTEQNMAEMFRRASDDNAVLVLDEADSFLFSRSQANVSWEISAVNEMLCQLEKFNGLFIATTNNFDGLDIASLRRFDAKIHFDYLKEEQIKALFLDTCDAIGLKREEICEPWRSLSQLTPGDFAAIVRQSRFSPVKGIADLCRRLADEAAGRTKRISRPIGFIHELAA